MKMTDKAVIALCKKKKVPYSHHDVFDEPRYAKGDDVDLRKAVIVVYSSQYGHWSLAVNSDGTISRPGDASTEMVRGIQRKIRAFLKKSKK